MPQFHHTSVISLNAIQVATLKVNDKTKIPFMKGATVLTTVSHAKALRSYGGQK